MELSETFNMFWKISERIILSESGYYKYESQARVRYMFNGLFRM